MFTNQVLAAVPINPCDKVDWRKSAICDKFWSYDCYSEEVYGLKEALVQANKRARSVDISLTTTKLPAVPVSLLVVVMCAGRKSSSKAYDRYCGLEDSFHANRDRRD